MICMEMSGNGEWIGIIADCLEEITHCIQSPSLAALFVAVVGSADCNYDNPGDSDENVGFRLVRTR